MGPGEDFEHPANDAWRLRSKKFSSSQRSLQNGSMKSRNTFTFCG